MGRGKGTQGGKNAGIVIPDLGILLALTPYGRGHECLEPYNHAIATLQKSMGPLIGPGLANPLIEAVYSYYVGHILGSHLPPLDQFIENIVKSLPQNFTEEKRQNARTWLQKALTPDTRSPEAPASFAEREDVKRTPLRPFAERKKIP